VKRKRRFSATYTTAVSEEILDLNTSDEEEDALSTKSHYQKRVGMVGNELGMIPMTPVDIGCCGLMFVRWPVFLYPWACYWLLMFGFQNVSEDM